MKNTIIYLIAFPGTGKLTVAKEIIKKSDAILVDNHLINNPVFSLFKEKDGHRDLPDSAWGYCSKIWRIILDVILNETDKDSSYILTNYLNENDTADKNWFNQVEEFSNKRGAKFIPIRLMISDTDEHKKRIISTERKERMKLTDPNVADKYKNCQLIKITHPNLLDIETSNTTPAELAEIILKHVESV